MPDKREIGDSISLLILCGVFLCYLPIILNWEIRDRFITAFDLCSTASSLLIAALAVAFPLSVDVIFNRDLPWRVILSRWLLLSSLIIPNLCAYLVTQQSSSTFASAFMISNRRARQMLSNGGLLTIYDQSVPYQRRFRVCLVFVGIVANLCQCLVPFLRDPLTVRALVIIGAITSISGTIGFLFSCFYYIHYVTRTRKEPLSFVGKYTLVNSILLAINILMKGIYRVSASHGEYSDHAAVVWISIDSVTAVLAFVVPNRMAIEEAAQARVCSLEFYHLRTHSPLLVDLSSSKEFCSLCQVDGVSLRIPLLISFLPPLSHEVRTPLNTLSMGLDLLITHEIFKILPEDTISHFVLNASGSRSSSSNQSRPQLSPHPDPGPTILECNFPQPSKFLQLIPLESEEHDEIPQLVEEPQPTSSTPIMPSPKEIQIQDALEIMESMRQSCETAICTLNDVLLYDKIEGGTMVLEKRPIPVLQLLAQAVKPFFLQVHNSLSLSLLTHRSCLGSSE
jgi:hypothetical protein